ncbi:hypothetical protein [Komagataeibacter europaeus]|uniref:hypothetical protein n=1 Tax=Komagataeibacter europaeus TaxID=33995 RepID=UPI0015F8584D|nr:hypothetical protein [Komagataeibacter europaeus]
MIESILYFSLLLSGLVFTALAHRNREKTRKNIGLAEALERHNHALEKFLSNDNVLDQDKERAIEMSRFATDPNVAKLLLASIDRALKQPLPESAKRGPSIYRDNLDLFFLRANTILSAVVVASWVAYGDSKMGDRIMSEVLDCPQQEEAITRQIDRKKSTFKVHLTPNFAMA